MLQNAKIALLLAFNVATLYIFEMLLLYSFQYILYQGHRHQYSLITRNCIYMVGKNIHQL
jgi:hypothetical protein